MSKFTPKQREVLRTLAQGPAGFDRWIYGPTVDALENKGLITRLSRATGEGNDWMKVHIEITDKGREELQPKKPGPAREFADHAEKQRVYRARKEEAADREKAELHRLRAAVRSILKSHGENPDSMDTGQIIFALETISHRAHCYAAPKDDFKPL